MEDMLTRLRTSEFGCRISGLKPIKMKEFHTPGLKTGEGHVVESI